MYLFQMFTFYGMGPCSEMKEFYNTKIKRITLLEVKGQFQVNDPCHQI